MPRNSSGAVEARKQVLRDPRRHADDHGVVLRRAAAARRRSRGRRRGRPRNGSPRRRSPKRTVEPRAARKASAGSMKLLREPMAGEQRMAGAAAGRECLAQQSRRQRGRAFRRIGVQRGGQERAPQPLVERALATHGLADRCVPAPSGTRRAARNTRSSAVPGTRFFRSNSHHGIRPSLEIEPPALAARSDRRSRRPRRRDRAAFRASRSGRDSRARACCLRAEDGCRCR